MRKNIIQSKTEPNKNDIWLSEEGLKKYGKKGWESLGGGVSPNTPIVNEVSGNELVPINVNGENKAVSAAALVKGSVEFYTIDLDNYSEKDYNNYQKAKADGKSIYVIKNGKHFLATIGYYGLIVKEPVIYGSKEYLNSNLNSVYSLYGDKYSLKFQYYDEYYCYVKYKSTNSLGFETYVTESNYDGKTDNYRFIANKIIVTFKDGELKNKQIIFHKAFNFDYYNSPSNIYIGFFSSDKKNDTGEIDYTAKTIEVFYAEFYAFSGPLTMTVNKFNLADKSGNGTKFLSDDGTYKEVSSGSEPVIIEITSPDSTISLTDTQIEAAKNGNIKIKSNAVSIIQYFIPYYYMVVENQILIVIRYFEDGVFQDMRFVIDIANKNMSKFTTE